MNHQAPNPSQPNKYAFSDFYPLITIFLLIFSFTIARRIYAGYWCTFSAMSDFMGSFFIVFGTFKIMNLQGFAHAYAMYDIIAKEVRWYGYIYPFIEIALGISYFMRWKPFATNLITLVLMSVGSIGVAIQLAKKQTVVCACLGAVFKIPMTYVTLLEDLLMAVMAAIMLFMPVP